MLLDIVYLVAGLIILVLGGDALVKGAVSLSLRLGIPALVVGLTVVAFGTSAPELLVSIQAVLSGRPGIALGNVIGSNIVNVLLILGLPLLFTVIHSSKIDARRGYVVMLLSSVLFIAVCFAGPITWVHALILLTGMSLMLLDNLRIARAHRAAASHDLEIADPHMRPWKIALLIVGGLIGLALGANLLVEGAVNIARVMGVSETAIGLTLVALGTSLPELVTSVIAAVRKQADVALGNVIGSNTFNLLGIIGVAGLFGDLPVPQELLRFDLWIMLGASLVLAPFVLGKRDMGRMMGVGMIGAYGVYAVSLVI